MQKVILKIGKNVRPEVKTVIVAPELPSTIDYVLLNNGTCIVSEQSSKKLGGLKKS